MSPGESAGLDLLRLAPETAREIDHWESEMRRFLGGDLSPEKWRAFRLVHGVYGQRQDGVQMIRVKIPAGVLTGAQLSRLADVAEEFSTGVVHLTTRQDVQLYFVQLERVPSLLRSLAEAGLTTREACGNSVRNVTACPLSGLLAEELFESKPYALAVYAFLVRNPFCQQMARKFKIALSACPEDCAATAIHDIGLLGRVVESGGRSRYGFKVLVGGGLGPTPFVAKTLEEFVPAEDLLATVKAILRVYSDLGNRRSKAKARLKFVVHRLGIEAFRARVLAARSALMGEEREETELLRYVPGQATATVQRHLEGRPGPREAHPAPDPGQEAERALAARGDEDFARWESCSVRPHRDPARAVVTVMVPLGDLEAPKLRALARLAAEYGEDDARIGREQNLVLPSVRREDLPETYRRLAALGLAEAGAGTALDVTSCPGADTCRLGITASKGLARAIRSELLPLANDGGLDLLRGVSVKISGCPNACGQHHVANIGFHGVVKTFDGKQAPAYQIHVGGRAGGGDAVIGRALVKIPARNVPKAASALLSLYGSERTAGETFADFAARVPDERFRAFLAPFAEEPPPEQERHLDWGRAEPFSTDDLGVGECAGAGEDAVSDPFDNYRAEILQASLYMEDGQWADALANLNRSQYTLARVLLDVLEKKPESDYEVTCELRAQVIDRGSAGELWNELHEEIARALRTKHPSPSNVRSIHRRAEALLEEAKRTRGVLARRRAEAGASAEVPG